MFVLIVLFIIVIIALVKLAGGTQKADVYVTVKSRQKNMMPYLFLEKTAKN